MSQTWGQTPGGQPVAGKVYRMNFNPDTCTWDPVRIQAALNEGSENLEALLALSPEFKVEDDPAIPNGFRGGLITGVLRVVDRKLIEFGKWAEFHIALAEMATPADRMRMAAVLQNQLTFPFKLTLYPLSHYLPGAPFNVMNAMVERAARNFSVVLQAPLDRMKLYPEENPLRIATNAEAETQFVAALEKMDYETMTYVPARDRQGAIVLPRVDTRSATQREHLLNIRQEKDETAVRYTLSPRRFIVGDGTPLECTAFYVRCPESFDHVTPNQAKVNVQCDTYPVEVDVRVFRGRQELFRRTEVFSGEDISVSVTSQNPSMNWHDVTLAWQVAAPGRFYAKSHHDWGRVSLAEARTTAILLVKGDAPLTRDTLDISLEDQPVDGTLQVSKCGWTMVDRRLDELLPTAGDSLSERMRGAVLEVTCEAVFTPQRGQLHVPLDGMAIEDLSGVLTWNGDASVGRNEGGKLVFDPEGEQIPGKVVSLHLKLEPEDLIRDHLEEICHRALLVGDSLAPAVSAFAKGALTHFAQEKNATLGYALHDIHGKLLATEVFFGKALMLQKDLDIAFDLRAKAAAQILNDIIGVLVEFVSIYIQSRVSQGTLLNADNAGVQAEVRHALQMEKLAKSRIDKVVSEVRVIDGDILSLEQALSKANDAVAALADKTSDMLGKSRLINASPEDVRQAAEFSAAVDTAVRSRNAIFEELAGQQSLKTYRLGQIDKLNKALGKKGDALGEALKALQTEIGVLQTGGKEGLEEAVKACFEKDHELLSQLYRERGQVPEGAFLQPLQQLMDQQSGSVSDGETPADAPGIVDILLDGESYSRFVDGMIASLGEAIDTLWGTIERIPTALSAIFRDWSWVNAVVNEPYRSDYAGYKGKALKLVPARIPQTDQALFSGKFVIDEVNLGRKPDREMIERAKGIWLDEDYRNRQETRDLIRHWAEDVLTRTVEEKGWTDASPDAMSQVVHAADRLIALIKAYDVSFDGERKWQLADNPSWQHVTNLINEGSFYVSWTLRILSWASMYTGVLAPVALGLSKAGDIVDIGGAMLQAGISTTLTLPEINGIVEAVPLLTAMMHHAAMTPDRTFEAKILDA